MSEINLILADSSASVSDLKKNPMAVVKAGEGFPVAILNRNKPAFYCVPSEEWERLLDKLEDIELSHLAKGRINNKSFRVDLDEL
ncbi:plasmid stabilization protein [Marinicella pacifica]|uniref:Antitoxin n=1 Tax=Marinicella pacifica TaxID=1171543 RepID=A0A917FI55_9GAMM|nr:type II toxin-antitoxin system Phd/YefM family antitoxin [Marinicella pacifica]GGF83251.1 plasmid stabilization protein [Marinicella pacifica]